MEKTIFSRIADREIPAEIVWENEKFIAFLDVLPVHLGHTILIPKQQIADLEDMSDEDLGEFMIIAKRIGEAMLKGLGVKGYSLFLDNKDAASRHVPHVHFHIVPRVDGDGLSRWPQTAYEAGEASQYAEKIKQGFN